MIDGYFLINNLFLPYTYGYIYYVYIDFCVCIYYYAFEISLTSTLIIATESSVRVSYDSALSQIENSLIETLEEHQVSHVITADRIFHGH